WRAYSIDLSKFINADPGAIYRVELSSNKAYSLYDCTANTTASISDDEYDDYYYEDDYYGNDYSEDAYTEDDDLREEAYWDNLIYSYKNYSHKARKSTRLNSSHVKISYAVFC